MLFRSSKYFFGRPKKYLLKATAACVSFGMAKDRKLLYCGWGGSPGRLKWHATGEKHLSDVFLSIDLLQSDRGLDLAEQTNWILTSYVFVVAWIIFFLQMAFICFLLLITTIFISEPNVTLGPLKNSGSYFLFSLFLSSFFSLT